MNVDVREKEKRLELINFLEQEGFTCVDNGIRNREWVIESVLPIVVDFDKKTYDRIGNVTCAAALASAKGIHGEKIPGLKAFYRFYQEYQLGGETDG